MSAHITSTKKDQNLIKLIRKFTSSKSPESLHRTELDIINSAITLEDLITIITLCPSGSVPFESSKSILIETAHQRSLDALVQIYENIAPKVADEIRAIAFEGIINRATTIEHWVYVMDSIKFPGHELSQIVYDKLMMCPQDMLTIAKLHRLTIKDSRERKFLENCLILPYLPGMPEEYLVDITIFASPNSKLVKKAQTILDRINV